MRVFFLILITLILFGVGFFVFQNKAFFTTKSVQTTQTKITADQAVAKVKDLPEVKEYLKKVPHGIVDVDNTMAAKYFIHVYEIKDGHTATFQWYKVDNKTGVVIPD